MLTAQETWQNEDVVCAFFCMPAHVDKYGEYSDLYPDVECDVHWAPAAREFRNKRHLEHVTQLARARLSRHASSAVHDSRSG